MFFFVHELRANERARVIYLPLRPYYVGLRGERELFAMCVRACESIGGTRRRRLFVLDILKISIRAGKWGKTRHTFCCGRARRVASR